MRVIIQRVNKAYVEVNNKKISEIGNGMLILLGVEENDNEEDIEWLCSKISKLRIFPDENEVMNLSINDINGDIIVVSQFTLYASTKKGARPSFIKSAKPLLAVDLYNKFILCLEKQIYNKVLKGEFGAMMNVNLQNNGPVTIIIDSKIRE